METWVTVWREGFVPQFTKQELEALREGLINDDPRILQGCTTYPPPLKCVEDWPCEGACAIGYIALAGNNLTVGEVEEHFARCCYNADQLLKDPAKCRYFLNFFDDTPRHTMREELIEELNYNLAQL